MLRFNRLICENFGPFFGREEISFPEKNGVIIVNGQNGHGKSSILEAVRFVIFGEVKDGLTNVPLFTMVNLLGIQEGMYTLKVTLDVDYKSNNYLITRAYSPKKEVKLPVSDLDYDSSTVMVKTADGSILSEKDTERLLAKIMNKNIARFYLFDGELLDEYKRVLSVTKKSVESAKIKGAIEDILGLPILTNTRDHVNIYLSECQRKLSEATQSKKNTEEYGKLLNEAIKNKKYFKDEVEVAKSKSAECDQKREEYKQELSKNQDEVDYTSQKKALQKQLSTYQQRIDSIKSAREAELKDAWLSLILSSVSKKRGLLQKELQDVTELSIRLEERKKISDSLQESLNTKYCSFCHQKLDQNSTVALRTKFNEISAELQSSTISPTDISNTQVRLNGDLAILKKVIDLSDSRKFERIQQYDTDLEGCETDLMDTKLQLDHLDAFLEHADLGEEELSRLVDGIQKETDKKRGFDDAYTKANKGYADALIEEDKAKKQLDKLRGENVDLDKALKYNAFVQSLRDLLEMSIDEYRNDRRQHVEKDASELYCALSEEKSYIGLRINESYGIEVLRQNGEVAPRSSSGYAHLKAFALIGGLHKNAPVQGPLFMDTPSGRLDKSNSKNLISILPKLSDQVILLIHDKELDKSEIYKEIPEYIVAEYTIDKISDIQSIIRKEAGGSSW